MLDNIDIFVVANPHRKPLIAPYLKGINATIYKTPDYKVSKGWKSDPKWRYIYKAQGLKGANGHLRCNTGHQDCLKKMVHDKAFMLEDDAVPKNKRWKEVVELSIPLLKKYEVVSLHGRLMRMREWETFRHAGHTYLRPRKQKTGDIFCCGSLAYLITKEAANKMIDLPFTGMPQDMTICNKFTFCVLKNSPFNHDRRQGSLIE